MDTKTILIIGAGPRVGLSTASKFFKEGFKILLISRDGSRLERMKKDISGNGQVVSVYEADVADSNTLLNTFKEIISAHGTIDAILYNVAHIVHNNILEESEEGLVHDYRVNVIGLLTASKFFSNSLQRTQGSILIIGGSIAVEPKPEYASLSMTSAALRSMMYCLADTLKDKNIYVALLMIHGSIDNGTRLHSPINIANMLWGLYRDRLVNEIMV
ncbi:SDR family NAD(P)-dependent oxidoreductase [Flagellimonas olearia]|uniref:SDR family NAD(P)-dependent oxidoreductase n=1 Tax=Flagellimonas olearia TaxID=552546 RepID=A0A6I1E2Y3_9FLAO|nr:SDR family NAD(P)-dependent oxidoreductase [Allomuricauda olearia]KAB7530270.1 SDR family NAD(P)-dependent oxidoreductase [Allomuricauda olearia]